MAVQIVLYTPQVKKGRFYFIQQGNGMSGFLKNLLELYREQVQRHRNRPFLRAAMAGCALVSMASGNVTLRERVRVDQVLETLDALQVYDPHEGVELFNEFVDALLHSEQRGRKLALEAIDAEVTQEPEKAELLIRICLAVIEVEDGIPTQERRQVAALCEHLGVPAERCGSQDAPA
jgi:tellurite resistance protein